MGPIAAMALPLQIAVPAVIRIDELPRTCKSLPSARPTRSAKKIFASVGIDCEKSIRPGAERARVPQVDCGRRTPLAILPPENVEIFQRTSSLRLRWRGLAAVGVGKNMSGRLFKRFLRSGRGCRKGRLWRRRVGLGLGGRAMREGGDDFLGGGFADLA